ncbi:cysteine-rich receptor-like protein kinase 6 [Miscanthus floridulus]|uniref:cysteine-rich receptor-like protein kinase 6 n=1 Tax=Miscanthus floridulus TaxID=154761 RepID=UPI0034594AAE
MVYVLANRHHPGHHPPSRRISPSVVVLLATSPLAAAAWSESGVACGGRSGSSYGANSTYEANLRHLAAVLPAETSASHRHSVDRAIGYWPNRVETSASCWTWTDDDGDCATCIAEAFKELERVCPFRREATFSGDDCNLRLAEFRIFSIDVFRRNPMFEAFAMGIIFQAVGLACLFFLFIQAWRHDSKKGTMTRHTPLLSGDK